MTDLVPIKRALISLSDKSGLDRLAEGLASRSIEDMTASFRRSMVLPYPVRSWSQRRSVAGAAFVT